jgi:hypothetical protein
LNQGHLAIGYWLLAIDYWLLAMGYWLLAIGYWLLTWILAIGYWLLAMHWPIFIKIKIMLLDVIGASRWVVDPVRRLGQSDDQRVRNAGHFDAGAVAVDAEGAAAIHFTPQYIVVGAAEPELLELVPLRGWAYECMSA